jgi:hypothetical protein
LIAAVAADLAPKLSLDRDELESQGYSPANHSRQFAALIEVLVCELYSILDGLRFTTYHLYRDVRGVQVKSTSRLFTKAAEGSYGADFPDDLNQLLAAVADSSWFPNLRRLRTAFTHGGLGSCHLSQDRTRISYMNASLGDGGTSHVIPDIVAHLNSLAQSTFTVLRDYFDFHYQRLEQIESKLLCGMYRGRGYMRRVKPEPDLSFSSGVCEARQWFDGEPSFRCPLADSCLAYARAAA